MGGGGRKRRRREEEKAEEEAVDDREARRTRRQEEEEEEEEEGPPRVPPGTRDDKEDDGRPSNCELLIGLSTSGKSFYVNRQIRKMMTEERALIGINCKPGDFDDLPMQHMTLDSVKGVTLPKKAILVIDDVVDPTPSQLRIMKNVVLTQVSHQKLSMFMCSHSFASNCLNSVYPHCQFITFCQGNVNSKAFMDFAKYHRMDLAAAGQRWDAFNGSSKRAYLRYKIKERSFQTLDWRGDLTSSQKSLVREKISLRLPFSHSEEHKKAMCLFDHIFENVDIGMLREQDFGMSLKYKGERVEANFLDFLYFTGLDGYETRNAVDVPPPECVALYKTLKKMFSLPKCYFIGTPYLPYRGLPQ